MNFNRNPGMEITLDKDKEINKVCCLYMKRCNKVYSFSCTLKYFTVLKYIHCTVLITLIYYCFA